MLKYYYEFGHCADKHREHSYLKGKHGPCPQAVLLLKFLTRKYNFNTFYTLYF